MVSKPMKLLERTLNVSAMMYIISNIILEISGMEGC